MKPDREEPNDVVFVPMNITNYPTRENVVGQAGKFIDDFLLAMDSEVIYKTMGVESDKSFLITGPPGNGKCHGEGVKILMYDCSVKNVEDIRIGDLLMGDDSTPRKVLSITSGFDKLYKIKQKYGDDYICNSEHILCLRSNSRKGKYGKFGEVFEIPVKDYIKNIDVSHLKGYKVPLYFNKRNIEIDPYFLGLWLGDGSKNDVSITNNDYEIVDYIYKIKEKYGYKINIIPGNNTNTYRLSNKIPIKGSNKILTSLKKYNILNNKHIPKDYLYNNEKIRYELLAGILDTDGNINCNCFEITQKNYQFAVDIMFLARSLGFRANIKEKLVKLKKWKVPKIYYRVGISGDIIKIPTKVKRKIGVKRKINKNPLNYGISIIPQGYGKYFGFTITGNGRYLLADLTVTHNTLSIEALVNHANIDAFLQMIGGTPLENIQPALFGFKYDTGKYGTAYINEGSKIVENFFNQCFRVADKGYKTVVVFDEAESLFGKRTDRISHKEDAKVLQTIMKNMQILHDRSNLYAVMMSNYPEAFDEASIRAGRVDKRYEFTNPNLKEREFAYKHSINQINYQAGYGVIRGYNTRLLADQSNNFSYADIAESVSSAVKLRAKQITKIRTNKLITAGWIGQKRLEDSIKEHKDKFVTKKSKKIGFV